MKKIIILFSLCSIILVENGFADDGQNRGRRGMMQQWTSSSRASTASKNQIAMPTISISTEQNGQTTSTHNQINMPTNSTGNRVPSLQDGDLPSNVPTENNPNQREKEKQACLNNNIGMGNTFVWASRYSNTNDYASMKEDVENPENNVCFVRVSIKSDDARIDVSDIPSQYFVWGNDITCGSWVDSAKLEQRILDAKKNARTWATIGGAVGGAGVGVGAMELFGNKLIGGAVQGQKALSGNEKLRSQLLVLKQSDVSKYNAIVANLEKLQEQCGKLEAYKVKDVPAVCSKYDVDYLLRDDK